MSDLKGRLKHANTINQVIQEVNQDYNLDKELGLMSKIVVQQGIEQLLKKLNIPKRVKVG